MFKIVPNHKQKPVIIIQMVVKIGVWSIQIIRWKVKIMLDGVADWGVWAICDIEVGGVLIFVMYWKVGWWWLLSELWMF